MKNKLAKKDLSDMELECIDILASIRRVEVVKEGKFNQVVIKLSDKLQDFMKTMEMQGFFCFDPSDQYRNKLNVFNMGNNSYSMKSPKELYFMSESELRNKLFEYYDNEDHGLIEEDSLKEKIEIVINNWKNRKTEDCLFPISCHFSTHLLTIMEDRTRTMLKQINYLIGNEIVR